jgi:hypothetical protein
MPNHLSNNNVSYFQHLKRSLRYSRITLCVSLIFVIHGFFPNTFEYTGTKKIFELCEKFKNRK